MLKRTKEGELKDVLPTKRDCVVFCKLSPLQTSMYRCAHAAAAWHLRRPEAAE